MGKAVIFLNLNSLNIRRSTNKDKPTLLQVCFFGSFEVPVKLWQKGPNSKHDGNGRQRERHQTEGLISRTMAVHVRYNL